ncbi:hypothetical protein A3K34_04610 [candidate division WWE3 bacterium RIFOXYC1_FULL_40_10]|uniref:ParB-like catalytic effector domain-containing protein n=1 Tax=candidate division WWE3 bacterium RIFOXYA2_FULL_46_9 TaxID=1802636 RepID=A0A1F4W148_UNCKA|nr:MAG: hypothetical protein A3K58_04610 [candidate division WWE3 bacterium RIFOXYB1_FULL_40_22]OGC62123.1 MAG: hypothetical protein A3K37_04610 [candidate division WWE3 bacterium RIFOXYA1_FULL_40_11]OGC63136.1 MAG: hypothetical protein A2264_00355 [candidate division WWE3 bacterium RIFOXYA2_FULL_46_9]OGC64934.1 MAG: hypothetical protein A2326_02755 [candidate division WWE3 bacterium RIFOXYB2_FULL_41_6]OGC66506.1 MAG: hypothetical protein A3K34_04610 [candidate division WWE3 bacterium RIFOXYC1_
MARIVNPTPGDPFGEGHLCDYLRESIWLNTNSGIHYLLPKPYEYADFEILSLDPAKLVPLAKYVLRGNLAILESLEKELLPEGFDIFNLRGMVQIDENNLICPPIIEVWHQDPHKYDGRKVIVDGLHRCYIAHKRGIAITCVLISGKISSDLPVLPLTWNDVLEQDSVPKDKRNYHPGIPPPWKPHEVYRQTFPGSTGPRMPKI